MLQASNSIELLNKIETENLYFNLIQQLNKDFQMCNLTISFEETIAPIELKEKLNAILKDLFANQYDAYLNFLYRVDVPEKELLKIKENDVFLLVEQITFLVLKREFQKVWLKQNF